MSSHNPEDAVAIVGYGYRMPGGIRTDDDFWSLLSEREIVREPITERYGRGYRPIGEFSGPGRFASAYEGLIREGGEKLFDRSLFGMSHHEMLSADPHVRMLLTCTPWQAISAAAAPILPREPPTICSTSRWMSVYGRLATRRDTWRIALCSTGDCRSFSIICCARRAFSPCRGALKG